MTRYLHTSVEERRNDIQKLIYDKQMQTNRTVLESAQHLLCVAEPEVIWVSGLGGGVDGRGMQLPWAKFNGRYERELGKPVYRQVSCLCAPEKSPLVRGHWERYDGKHSTACPWGALGDRFTRARVLPLHKTLSETMDSARYPFQGVITRSDSEDSNSAGIRWRLGQFAEEATYAIAYQSDTAALTMDTWWASSPRLMTSPRCGCRSALCACLPPAVRPLLT